MKKFATMISFVALFVLLAVSASALTLNGATIGGENQDRIKNVSTTFQVTNNDTSSVSLTFASTAESKYNVRFEPATATVAPNQSTTVKVIADIPLDFDAVEPSKSATDYLDAKAFPIGEIQAKSGSTVVATNTLKMQAVNQLEVKKVRIDCDGSSESVADGEKVEDLKPDTKCSLEVDVENNFDEDDDEYADGSDMKIGDVEIETATVEIEVDDSDFDLDEEEDLDGLAAGDEDTITTDFDIADDVSDGTYTMTVYVYGEDDNGALHGESWEVRLDVTRLSHDIQLRSPSLSPDRVSACDGGDIRVLARIANFGKRDEDAVAVELSVPDLKFTKRVSDIELDSDDSTSVSFVVTVPENAKAGIYRATLTTFFDDTAESNSQALEFTVDKCDTQEVVVVPAVQQNTTTQTGTQPATPAGSAVAVPRARVSTSGGFADSSTYLWVLGGVGAVLLLIIILLLVFAFRKPRTDVL